VLFHSVKPETRSKVSSCDYNLISNCKVFACLWQPFPFSLPPGAASGRREIPVSALNRPLHSGMFLHCSTNCVNRSFLP
jgi:hypothetical protein